MLVSTTQRSYNILHMANHFPAVINCTHIYLYLHCPHVTSHKSFPRLLLEQSGGLTEQRSELLTQCDSICRKNVGGKMSPLINPHKPEELQWVVNTVDCFTSASLNRGDWKPLGKSVLSWWVFTPEIHNRMS